MTRAKKEQSSASVRRAVKRIKVGKQIREVVVYNLIHRGKVELECTNYGQAFRHALQLGYGGIRVE